MFSVSKRIVVSKLGKIWKEGQEDRVVMCHFLTYCILMFTAGMDYAAAFGVRTWVEFSGSDNRSMLGPTGLTAGWSGR